MALSRRLYRSRRHKMIAGVAGGIADWLGIPPILVRILWLILLIPGGLPGFIPYVLCWILIPQEPG